MEPHHVHDVLIPETDLEGRVAELAAGIGRDLDGRELVLVGILRGSFMFLADLVRSFHRHGIRTRIDFMILESYGSGTESSGTVRLARDCSIDVAGQDVLVVDDILDTGRTLSHAVRHLESRGALRVRTCVLLDKPSRRVVPFEADYVGFPVPDVFVVGYGLDYDHYYRDLPWISKVTFTG
ncbi:MAG: hypoxanthine phosphoribosyltransferase [Lentisphaerae bacterium]|nr:hypoxanthine phosphoribosyltransferase [Lentisphaerota bacterium]